MKKEKIVKFFHSRELCRWWPEEDECAPRVWEIRSALIWTSGCTRHVTWPLREGERGRGQSSSTPGRGECWVLPRGGACADLYSHTCADRSSFSTRTRPTQVARQQGHRCSSYEQNPYISAFSLACFNSVMVSYPFLVKTLFVYVWDLGDTRAYRHLDIDTQGV